MMVFKYIVPIDDNFIIEMPMGAEILSFQTQNNVMNIWVFVNPDSPTEERKFTIIGTGHYIDMSYDWDVDLELFFNRERPIEKKRLKK
jgi:hypothetical protein